MRYPVTFALAIREEYIFWSNLQRNEKKEETKCEEKIFIGSLVGSPGWELEHTHSCTLSTTWSIGNHNVRT